MRIVVTGAAGFMGSNLCWHLREAGFADVFAVTRQTEPAALQAGFASADFVFHLAGVNRPTSEAEFATGNPGLTQRVCDLLATSARRAGLAFTSSTQAEL